MKKEYIGKYITIIAIRNYILDKCITNKAILLHSKNFDDIVLEYRSFYNESMSVPYELLGNYIGEDYTKTVPMDRISVIDYDTSEFNYSNYEETFDLYDGEQAYRCGFCGRIVDGNGNELYDEERNRIIRYIENFENPIVNNAYGKCCRDKW